MFSYERKQQIEDSFEKLLPFIGNRKDVIESRLGNLTIQEAVVMKFLYTSMPLSDIGNYEFDTFLDYARHGIFLWEQKGYKEKIPVDIFLNYVLYHRVNEEEITECRSYFYQRLAPCVVGLGMKEVVLEVNYWCAREATYRSTDERTIAPMAVYKTGYGRCGEESTFTVSALRSLGIPARQVYVPRWSHCDDNHAWVEAWCDGTWYFIGACEPESMLNKGWFLNASSRAMLAHSRRFGGISSGEEITENDGVATIFNTLSQYARTKQIKVQIINQLGVPVKKVKVYFEILNDAEFVPVASLTTDDNGMVNITLGLGNIHIHAYKGGQLADSIIDIREKSEFIITLGEGRQENIWIDFDITVPEEKTITTAPLTQEQKSVELEKVKLSVQKRLAKMEDLRGAMERKRISLGQISKEVEAILVQSSGNYEEIAKFLQEKSKGTLEDKEDFLKLLSEKDYRDCKSSILLEHLDDAIKYAAHFQPEIFMKYVLNPRIYFEPLSRYREFINGYYKEEEKQLFRKEPILIWKDIQKKIIEYKEREYSHLVTTPTACLSMEAGSHLSKKIAFVAICRTLGIPARMNQMNLSIEYYKEGQFKPVENTNTVPCVLKIWADKEVENWTYFMNWSLGVLQKGVYHSLNLIKEPWVQGGLELQLQPGKYRIITTKRLLNGNLFAKEYFFSLQVGEYKEVSLCSRDTKLSDMMINYPLPDFELMEENGNLIKVSDIIKNQMNIFIWLEVGMEPTEHILNELYEKNKAFEELNGSIFVIVKDKNSLKNQTIKRAVSSISKIEVYYDSTIDNVNKIGRRMYVDPDKLPLIVVTDNMSGVFALNGYNVGTADLLLRIFAEYHKR